MEIWEGQNYWAKVGFVSTLSRHRDHTVANIFVLRCNIVFAGSDIPLAVKAYWNRRVSGDKIPKVGDTILVTAYREHNHEPIRFKPAGKVKKMAMSKDRVRFFIQEQYFSTQAKRLNMAGVMAKAFGISEVAADSWLLGNGVWIVCRPSQFARFMIYRNDAHIINGFMNLHAELVKARSDDIYDVLAKQIGMVRADVKRVALALHFDMKDVEAALTNRFGGDLDVSQNPA